LEQQGLAGCPLRSTCEDRRCLDRRRSRRRLRAGRSLRLASSVGTSRRLCRHRRHTGNGRRREPAFSRRRVSKRRSDGPLRPERACGRLGVCERNFYVPPRAAAALPGDDGRAHVFAGAQGARVQFAERLGKPTAGRRVHGGSDAGSRVLPDADAPCRAAPRLSPGRFHHLHAGRRPAGSSVILTAHQPVYLPWLGMLHKIALADVYVSLDHVQYVHDDWVNRNRIKSSAGPSWLSVPVKKKGHLNKTLAEIEIDNALPWRRKHWRTLEGAYAKAPFFRTYAPFFEEVYSREWTKLVDLNVHILTWLMKTLGISTKVHRPNAMEFAGNKGALI